MLRRLMVVATVVCALGALMVGSAGAAAPSSSLVYDNGPLGGGARDNVGDRAGWVIAKQLRNGDLEINVEVRRGDASTSYTVFAYCGPTHVNPEGNFLFVPSGVTTNANGDASWSMVVSKATLTAFCGAGSQTGHIDLDSGFSTLASPLNFSS